MYFAGIKRIKQPQSVTPQPATARRILRLIATRFPAISRDRSEPIIPYVQCDRMAVLNNFGGIIRNAAIDYKTACYDLSFPRNVGDTRILHRRYFGHGNTKHDRQF